MKVTFLLNTSADRFAAWLEHYTGFEAPSFKISTESGEAYLMPAEVPDQIARAGTTRIDLAVYHRRPDEPTEWPFPHRFPGVITLMITQLKPVRLANAKEPVTEVVAWCGTPMAMEFFKELLRAIAERWPVAAESIAKALGTPTPQTPAEGGASKRRKPTIKTEERAKVFKRLKDKHPKWNYDKVAMEAVEELGEVVTGETVRNAYRAMREAYPDQAEEWTWKRADRIR